MGLVRICNHFLYADPNTLFLHIRANAVVHFSVRIWQSGERKKMAAEIFTLGLVFLSVVLILYSSYFEEVPVWADQVNSFIVAWFTLEYTLRISAVKPGPKARISIPNRLHVFVTIMHT